MCTSCMRWAKAPANYAASKAVMLASAALSQHSLFGKPKPVLAWTWSTIMKWPWDETRSKRTYHSMREIQKRIGCKLCARSETEEILLSCRRLAWVNWISGYLIWGFRICVCVRRTNPYPVNLILILNLNLAAGCSARSRNRQSRSRV